MTFHAAVEKSSNAACQHPKEIIKIITSHREAARSEINSSAGTLSMPSGAGVNLRRFVHLGSQSQRHTSTKVSSFFWNKRESCFKGKSPSLSFLLLVSLIVIAGALIGSAHCGPVRRGSGNSHFVGSLPSGGGNAFSTLMLKTPSSFVGGSGASAAVSSSSAIRKLQIESGASLSIVSPLDILRQNMMKEILRRKQIQSKHRQLQLNQELLDKIG